MTSEIRHYCKIKNRKILWEVPALYYEVLDQLHGCDAVVTIKKRHVKASNNQYGFYRGGILPECYKTEMFSSLDNKDSIHDLYFAPKFLSYKKLAMIGGKQKEITLTRSLADLSTEEMTEFITKVLAECHHLEIQILPPEMYHQKYYTK